MADRDPWFKFHPDYWLTDPELRSCSGRSRGALIDTMALLSYSSRYGFLVLNETKPTRKRNETDAEAQRNRNETALTSYAKQLVWRPETYRNAIQELLDNGVLEQDEQGVIYCPRMVLDWEKRQKAQEDGRKGGNPNVVNPPVKAGVNPTLNPDTERDTDKEEEREEDPAPIRLFINHWCQKIGPLILDSETSCRLGDIYRNFERELPDGAKPTLEILTAEINELAKRPPTKRTVKYFEGLLWGKLNEE